jgi:hypothetical protein
VNFVILDYDIKEQRAFAGEMSAARHPAFALIPPNGAPGDATALQFGPLSDEGLREYLDTAIADYGG